MMPAGELTMEELSTKIDAIAKIAEKMEKDSDDRKDSKKAETEKEDKMKARRAKRDDEMKEAMTEEDDDKRDAKMKRAMDDYDKDHKAMGDNKDHNDNHKGKSHKAEKDEDEKERDAATDDMIKKDKEKNANKILMATKIINPSLLAATHSRLKSASASEIRKEWKLLEPFVGSITLPTTITAPDPVPVQQVPPPFMPSYAQDTDNEVFTASTPDSAFTKFTTQELLDGKI